jgi:hypothetical protein
VQGLRAKTPAVISQPLVPRHGDCDSSTG